MNNAEWDAETYTSNFDFVPHYGKDLLTLMHTVKGNKVLDLGCGNGALTKELADAGYDVEGLDASPELIALARKQYPSLTFTLADATTFLLKEKIDAVFSNAVFHWVDKTRQLLLLRHIADALKTGGELVCEFGGKGNNAQIHQALYHAFSARSMTYHMPFFFPSIGEYASLLESAGLQVKYALLFDRLTPLKGADGLSDWIRMFVKMLFKAVPTALKNDIINDVVDALRTDLYVHGQWYADYVRLRIRAVKI